MSDADIALVILGVCFLAYWVALLKSFKDN